MLERLGHEGTTQRGREGVGGRRDGGGNEARRGTAPHVSGRHGRAGVWPEHVAECIRIGGKRIIGQRMSDFIHGSH